MPLDKVLFIINPGSGQDYPILSDINRIVRPASMEWDIVVTKNAGDAYRFAQRASENPTLSAVAAYGGDGTIMEVARALFQTGMPMIVLPGGTANVVAREHELPLEIPQLLNALVENRYSLRKMDMGIINSIPFLIRVNFGILADMVLDTKRSQKNKLGKLAYGITAAKKLGEKPLPYHLIIDGKEIEAEGVGLTVTNVGNVGISNMTLHPDIDPTDGKLDVVLMKNSDLLSLFDLASSTLTHSHPQTSLDHWQGSEIEVVVPKKQSIICDDEHQRCDKFIFKSVPEALTLVQPTSS